MKSLDATKLLEKNAAQGPISVVRLVEVSVKRELTV